jgi:regulation of enolase protein 1 (concanavalin A-like superfamily)
MQWLNEPPHWTDDGRVITATTGERTDFWRLTHYGFIRDTGHLYHRAVRGDFTAEVEFAGRYEAQYDQAGLMLRVDAETWLKCGVEYVDGAQHLSAVVTRGHSDWSVVPLDRSPDRVRLRLERRADALEVSFSTDGSRFTMLRLAHLPMGDEVRVGVMCASPERAGFQARFEGFAVRPLAAR